MFLKKRTNSFTESCLDRADMYRAALDRIEGADAVVIGAGAGLSTSAGFTYSGARFEKYFADMERAYGFHDMYSGGFYNYDSPEKLWGFWCRYIYINRYMDAPKPVYHDIFERVKDKNYFVLTTNVDHCFQKAGFDKNRLFYTQGDYGLFQCSQPCHKETYDNEEIITKMVLSEGYEIKDGRLVKPKESDVSMEIPSELVPVCPKCGRPMSMNLRSDCTFVQDAGWYAAAERYESFLRENRNTKTVFVELGVGYNTPGIIKYPFWQMVENNPKASYICINKGEAYVPREIADRSVCIDGDIYDYTDRNED